MSLFEEEELWDSLIICYRLLQKLPQAQQLVQARLQVRALCSCPQHVLYCAVLCCAVLCCAVLCCAVLCCAVLCCAVLCCAVLCCAVLCCAVLCCAVLCCAVLCCAVLCCAVLCCAVPAAPIQLCMTHHVGAAVQVTPDNASLLCALGDITLDDSHYEKAWKASCGRSARAQRSLARSAQRQQQWGQVRLTTLCIPPFSSFFRNSLLCA